MRGSEPVVRKGALSDGTDLAALRWAWRVHERGERSMSEAEFRAAFVDWFDDHRGSHIPFIAEDAESSVGMAWLAIVARVPGPGSWLRLAGNLQSVYVLPIHRGKGLGSALVKAVLGEAVQRGLDYVSVHPSVKSFPLYRRLGFSETGGVLEADLRSQWP